MPITIKNSAGGGVTLDSSTSSNETINLNTPVFTAKTTISIAAANGDIIDLKSNNSDVGTIGTLGGATYFGSEDSGIMFNGVNQNPTSGGSTRVDNTNDLGAASYRYKDIYLGGGAFIGGTGTANKLDDYEEGTWSASASGISASFSNTSYVKIGRLVYITGHLTASANASGDVYVSGLPFAQASNENGIGTSMNYNVDVSGNTYGVVVYVTGSTIRFYRNEDDAPWVWLGQGNIISASQLLFNVCYLTNS